jgi:hypothetical protein
MTLFHFQQDAKDNKNSRFQIVVVFSNSHNPNGMYRLYDLDHLAADSIS